MGQMNRTIGVLMTIGVAAGALVFASGCADTPAQTSGTGVRSDVTDVRPMEPAVAAAYQPPMIDNSGMVPTTAQPVTTATPALDAAPPMMSSTPTLSTIGEKKHTVRRGETLFSIAKASYGSGKEWKKIVAANPGVSPSKLKVGQVLAMP
jgi:5'-nucleotidase/UDP-sugar diphosphatase